MASFYEQFIAIHARRGDFADHCKGPKTACLNSLSTFAEKVNEIRQTLLLKHDKYITQVLLSSSKKNSLTLSINLN